jgi:hypothetical protein
MHKCTTSFGFRWKNVLNNADTSRPQIANLSLTGTGSQSQIEQAYIGPDAKKRLDQCDLQADILVDDLI